MNKKKWMSGKQKSKIRCILGARDGWFCRYCGVKLIPDEHWNDRYYCKENGYFLPQLDHRIPISRGGTSDINNLVLSCGKCNRKKSNMNPVEFFIKENPEYIKSVLQ